MFRQLLKDASLYSLSSLLARGFSFITVPIYTRILTPADYGALDLLTFAALLVQLVLGCALDQAVGRFYLDPDVGSDERRRIVSSVFIFYVVIFGIFAFAVAPAATFIADRWLGGQVGPGTLYIVLVFLWAGSIFYVTNNQLRFMFRSRAVALLNIGNVVVSTAAGFACVFWFRLGVAGVFLGQAIGLLLFSLISIYLARDLYRPLFNWGVLSRLLRYSMPLVPGTVAFFAMQYVDRYILSDLRGLTDVGIYGMGARIASLLNLFLMGFQSAWFPHVMNNFREPGAREKFADVFQIYLFVTMTILIVLSLFGREVLLLLTTTAFAGGFVVVPLLVLGAVMASVANYFSYGIQIAEKNHYRMLLNLLALAASVGLNLLLIPVFGVLGAALANAVCLTVLAVGSMWASQRLYRVPYSWPAILTAIAVAVLVSNSVIFWHPAVTGWTILMKGMLAISSAGLVAYTLQVPIRLSSWRRLAGL